jgi:thioredoxin 1
MLGKARPEYPTRPTIKEMKHEHRRHPDITFAKVDTEAEPALSEAAHISSIPTVMALRDGVLVFAQPGALPERALEEVIRAVRELDMNEVRRVSAGRTPSADRAVS